MDIEKTCRNCDYNCPNHVDSDTCENWEHVIFSIDIPEDIINLIKGEPTSFDFQNLIFEAESLLKSENI